MAAGANTLSKVFDLKICETFIKNLGHGTNSSSVGQHCLVKVTLLFKYKSTSDSVCCYRNSIFKILNEYSCTQQLTDLNQLFVWNDILHRMSK